MKYLVILLASLSIASCASTTQDAETKTVTNTPSTTTTKSQYEALSLSGRLQVFKYAQGYRFECVRPSESFYLALGRLKEVTSDNDTSLSSDDLLNAMNAATEKVQAAKGNYQFERPTIELASSPETMTGLEEASQHCFEQTLNYFNGLPAKYIAVSEAQEAFSDISFLSAYFEAKTNLLIRSYAFETNEYRAHPDTDTYALDGYTEFMFRLYQFIAASNRLLSDSKLKKEQREELINSVQALRESRDKIDKDFELLKGVEMLLMLANYKKGDSVNFSDAFEQHENALNESIDTFYPIIEEMKLQIDSSSPDSLKLALLMARLDSLLIVHERRASNVRLAIIKTLAEMVTQAK